MFWHHLLKPAVGHRPLFSFAVSLYPVCPLGCFCFPSCTHLWLISCLLEYQSRPWSWMINNICHQMSRWFARSYPIPSPCLPLFLRYPGRQKLQPNTSETSSYFPSFPGFQWCPHILVSYMHHMLTHSLIHIHPLIRTLATSPLADVNLSCIENQFRRKLRIMGSCSLFCLCMLNFGSLPFVFCDG